MDAFLGEIADAVVLGLVDFAPVGLEGSADALHEGGLAGAVVAGEGNAFLISYGEGEVFENDTRSKFNAEVFDSKHAGALREDRASGKFLERAGRWEITRRRSLWFWPSRRRVGVRRRGCCCG